MIGSLTRLALSLAAIGAILLLLPGTPARALNNQSFVSNTGSDTFSCADVANACQTFAGALAKTAPGGQITVVNSGDYGLMLIGQSINVTNDGAGEASIRAGISGIAINAGVGDVISLRGLVVDGQGISDYGILINTASAVHIQNCVIRNLQGSGFGYGILFDPANSAQMFVSDTIVFNNGTTAATGGIVVRPFASGSATVVLDRVHLENNVEGIRVDGTNSTGNGSHVVVRDSVVSGNAGNGIHAVTLAGMAPAFLVVERSTSVNNAGVGVLADGPRATMLLDGNVVSRNGVGISAVNSGQLISYGNNKVNNNLGIDGTPTGSYGPI